MLWTLKHAPAKTADVCGNTESVSRIKKWALSFSLGQLQKPILVHGSAGSAKSAIAYALAKELELEIIPILPPTGGELGKWEKRLSEVLAGSSLFSSQTLVLCEDVDEWHLSKIRGLMQKFAALLNEANVPVYISAHDAYSQKIAPIRPYCELISLKAINHSSIASELVRISELEGLRVTSETIQKIALNSRGDLRAAINDLQAHNSNSFRESQKQQTDILKMVFRSPSFSAAKSVDLGPLMERSTLKMYVSENLPAEFFDAHDMAQGFDFLSRADIFDGRIMRRQYWGYLRYSYLLLLWGVSSCRRHIRAGFTPYSFPSYIRKMGATRSKRAIYKNAGLKIGPKCHCTSKNALIFIPLICAQMETLEPKAEVGQKLCSHYKFDEEELAAICGSAASTLYSKKPAKRKSVGARI